MSSDSDGNSSVDAIINTMKHRKAQLYRQQESVTQANQDAESIDLVAITRRKSDWNNR